MNQPSLARGVVPFSLAQVAAGLDSQEMARIAGVPKEAIELAWSSEVIDLHLESYLQPRLWGLDLLRRNHVLLRGHFFGHIDVPRALEGGLTGAMWSIATNIARSATRRSEVLERNCQALERTLSQSPDIAVVRSFSEYREARAARKHAAMICVQGGNALEGTEERVGAIGRGALLRVTLIHLTNSVYGDTSAPVRLRPARGLTSRGKTLVEALDAARIFVDLAHAGPRTFWDTVEVHDRTLPLIVTHTGVASVHSMWRNLDAAQIRAVAETGGVVGIIFHPSFLGRKVRDGRAVVDHIEAAIRAGGEECVALGSDFDGAITPSPDLRDGSTAYYRLVAYMLERKFSPERIRRILGQNFLKSLAALRP